MAVDARYARMIMVELGLGKIKNFRIENNIIYKLHSTQKVAVVIAELEFVKNIFNPPTKPSVPEPTVETKVEEIIVEEIPVAPVEEIIVEEIPEEIKVEEKVEEQKGLPSIDEIKEKNRWEPYYGPGFEVIIKQPEPVVEPPVEEPVVETPKKKRKYTRKKKK